MPSPAAAARHACGLIVNSLNAGIQAHGWGVLAVSGGTTPVETFRLLAEANVDWSRVWVTLVDERWVEAEESESNERLVRTYLLQGNAARAQLLPMKTSAISPLAGIGRQVQAFRSLPGPIDAVLLGMGEDGHFASLFPRSSALREGLDPLSASRCVAVSAGRDGAAPAQDRMSLTLAAILQARLAILLTVGTAKRAVLDHAMNTVSNPSDLPVAALLAHRPDIVILHSDL